jgi:hypothetical protein
MGIAALAQVGLFARNLEFVRDIPSALKYCFNSASGPSTEVQVVEFCRQIR